MNFVTATETGLSNIISKLQKQKEELTVSYHEAISRGEKLNEVKTLYLCLKDVDKKLNDLLRVWSIDV
ncbi:MAG TPA: hypothetical protein VGI61_13630 [Parafilimonas sp.]